MKRILWKILLGLVLLALAVILILQIGVTVRYWDYFSNSTVEFRIPGLWANFVPQGFHYMADSDTYLISGYMSDDSASRIYIRSGAAQVSFATLHYPDMSPYNQHAGGVCVNGEYVYLPGEDGVDVFLLEQVLDGKAILQGSIPMGFRVDHCCFHEGYLLVGNFYYPEYYETPDAHHIQTPAGDANTSLITVYKADADGEFGVDPNAIAAFSSTDRVQGMCVTSDDQIVLSTSWGLNDSVLYFYRIDTQRQGTVQTLTGETPLYYLDSENLTATVNAPPMSEELVYKDGRVWVMYESACNKYFFGRLIRGNRVYAFETE